MSKRKELFKLKKNQSGNPLLNARFFLKDFVFNGREYTELHVVANCMSVSFTIRNHKNFSIEKFGSSAMWERRPGGWLYRVENADQLKQAVMDLGDSFKANKIPEWVGQLHKEIGGVL